MKFHLPHTNAVTLLLVTFMAIVLAFILVVHNHSQMQVRQTCASFSSYNDAYRAYRAGDTELDRDGDGRPCEKEFPQAVYGG